MGRLSRLNVVAFLESNGFKEIDVNCKKSKSLGLVRVSFAGRPGAVLAPFPVPFPPYRGTYPLHEATKQDQGNAGGEPTIFRNDWAIPWWIFWHPLAQKLGLRRLPVSASVSRNAKDNPYIVYWLLYLGADPFKKDSSGEEQISKCAILVGGHVFGKSGQRFFVLESQ